MSAPPITARLVESREIGPEVRHFVFETVGKDELHFSTGQFVSFSKEIGGKNITRAYSIASVPQGNRFDLCLNRVEGGHFSPHLFEMQPGDSVNMKGPLGTFVWRRPVKPSILVATGTGIAPFRGMLLEELATSNDAPIVLIYGARYASGILYRDELEALAASHPRFDFRPTLTRPDETWQGRTGRVQKHVYEAIGDSTAFDVYLCGMKEMIDDIRTTLKARGFDRKQIISEKFD